MTSQASNPAPPDPPSSEPTKSGNDLVCPWCSYQIAAPDAANCPECGGAVRMVYANGWTIDSWRWLRRLTLCVLAISVLHLAASLVWPIVELSFWYQWAGRGAYGWFTNIAGFVEVCLDDIDEYWPMFLGLLLSSALLAIVAFGSFRNLRLLRSKGDPEPDETHRAWRRVFVMLVLVAATTAVQLVALWVQFFRV